MRPSLAVGHGELHAFGLRDISHRLWNGAQLGLKGIDLWPAVMLLLLNFNMEHAPRRDSTWFNSFRQGAEAYVKTTSAHCCDLFQSLLLHIPSDDGELERNAGPSEAGAIS